MDDHASGPVDGLPLTDSQINRLLAVIGGISLLLFVLDLFQGPFPLLNAFVLGVLSAGLLVLASSRVRSKPKSVPAVGVLFVSSGIYWNLFQRFSIPAFVLLVLGVSMVGWWAWRRRQSTD